MICGHGAKESHTSIFLCQGKEGRAREKKGLDEGVWGAEGEGANRAPNHILHLRFLFGFVYTYIHCPLYKVRLYNPMQRLHKFCFYEVIISLFLFKL